MLEDRGAEGTAGAAHDVLSRQLDRETHSIVVGLVTRAERDCLLNPLRPRDEHGHLAKIFRPWRIASVTNSGPAQQNQLAAVNCSCRLPTPVACRRPAKMRKNTNPNVTT